MRTLIAAIIGFAVSPVATTQGVTGEAAILFDGDRIETCSDQDVYAIPKTKKSEKRLKEIYGDTLPSFAHISKTPNIVLMKSKSKSMQKHKIPGPSEALGKYLKGTKKVACNGEGNFQFAKLKPGEWFIIAPTFYTEESTYSGQQAVRAKSGNLTGGTLYHGGTFAAEITVSPDAMVNLPFKLDGRTKTDDSSPPS